MAETPRDHRIFAGLFAGAPWLSGLSGDARALLAAGCNWRRLAGGETLFVEGRPSDAVFLLVHGGLAAFHHDAQGSARLVGHVVAGETVGELGVLMDRPRSATVRALRDSELVELPAAHLLTLADRFPQALLGLARLALRRSVEAQRTDPPPRTLAILPQSPGVRLDDAAARLARQLGELGSVEVLRSAAAGHDAEHYHRIEASSRFVLYVADGGDAAWRAQCRRQADALLFVARADESPGADAAWPDADDEAVARRQFLIVQHDGPARHGAARRWHALCPKAIIHHLRDDGDAARIARLIGGKGVALVLSGGGARGLAHVGVVRALREAGLRIDSIGGTSIGAIIGAGVAGEWSTEQMEERFRRAFHDTNPLSDYTLPLVSLVAGRKVSSLLRETHGAIDIEDLPLPFFCVSANLTRGAQHVHRDGTLWEALRASISIPGLLPPVFKGGEVFVDGGVVNNLPVDVMRAQHRGDVIASDIGGDHAVTSSVDECHLPAPWRLWLDAQRSRKRPRLREILLRAGMINSAAMTISGRAQSTMLIKPPLNDIGLLEWSAFQRIIERGHEHATRQIEQQRGSLAGAPMEA